MRTGIAIAGVLAVAAIAAGGYALYGVGMKQGMAMGAASTPAPAEAGRKVLYWHDPMVPGPRFDKPGKSPFMDMQLVPVYADESGGDAGGVRIDPSVQQNLGIRTAAAERTRIGPPAVEAVGSVAYTIAVMPMLPWCSSRA